MCNLNRAQVLLVTFVLIASAIGPALAQPVSEGTVEKACGQQIEGGCNKTQCATGCQKKENGKTYDYGCVFSSRPGKTKAKCNKTLLY